MFKKLRWSILWVLAAGLLPGVTCFAQNWEPTPLKDTSALKPPPGTKIAIVSFMDLQCPVCAQVDPVIEAAANQHHVAWIHHDFPLPMHNWSFAAAVNARFFDSKSPSLGNEYRDAVFANQNNIDNIPGLTQFTQQFAQAHHVDLPFIMDPGEKFSNEVKADRDLARRMNLQRTPTVFVVVQTSNGPSYTELLNRNGLDALIDQEQAKVTPSKSQTASKGHGE